MSQDLYYTPPSNEMFNDIKQAAILTWQTLHDDEFGYVTEKVNSIKDLENVGDNYMYMFAMFDYLGQRNVLNLVKDETRERILEATS